MSGGKCPGGTCPGGFVLSPLGFYNVMLKMSCRVDGHKWSKFAIIYVNYIYYMGIKVVHVCAALSLYYVKVWIAQTRLGFYSAILFNSQIPRTTSYHSREKAHPWTSISSSP